MNNWKCATALATCCIYLTTAPSAPADFVGVTTVNKDDPSTEFLCTQGNGRHIPGPLTVCNISAAFDNPKDRLLLVRDADITASNGLYFQHPFNFTPFAPYCGGPPCFPDLI